MVVVVAGAEAELLGGGGGGGRNGETTREAMKWRAREQNGENERGMARTKTERDWERKNEMARPREEERHCSREREKYESEKENAQKALKTGDTSTIVSGTNRVYKSLQNNF